MLKEYFIKNTQLRISEKKKQKGKFSKSYEFDIFSKSDEIPTDLEDLLIGVIKVVDDLETRLPIMAAISAICRCHTAILTRFS